jgi:hypothetical protein
MKNSQQTMISGCETITKIEQQHLTYKLHVDYMCSGWFFKQSIKSTGFISPIQILWTAVNNGNLCKKGKIKKLHCIPDMF